MDKKEIRDYLVKDYGLELVPPMTPINQFHRNKRDTYFDIAEFIAKRFSKKNWNKIELKIYRFFNKISPVKFPKERQDNKDYFYYRTIERRIDKEFEVIWSTAPDNPGFILTRLGDRKKKPTLTISTKSGHLEKIDKFMGTMIEFRHITREKNLKLLI